MFTLTADTGTITRPTSHPTRYFLVYDIEVIRQSAHCYVVTLAQWNTARSHQVTRLAAQTATPQIASRYDGVPVIRKRINANIGRIRLRGSERSFSLVRSFFHSTGSPHERLRIFRAYERSGVESRESSWNHVTKKRRPAEVEIGLERPVGFEIRLERSIKHVSSSDKYIIVIDFNDTQV